MFRHLIQHGVLVSRKPHRVVLPSLKRPSDVALRHWQRVQHFSPGAHQYAQRSGRSSPDDTIYALSTAPGRAAIAVIRVSGAQCLRIHQALCPDRSLPKPRVATLRKLSHPEDTGLVLDTAALILYFPSPHTVTGEDILELHVHGGTAIVRSILDAIPACAGPTVNSNTTSTVRAAEPGEFTRRAFYNNRLDLAEVEALGDALAAETEQQRRLAVSGAAGDLTRRYEEWRSMLLYARGELEALIDFSEDQHFDESPAEFMRSVSTQVKELQQQIKTHVLNASRGELLRSGISIALLGAPNAGKSSLLNKLVKREAAIVSAEAGTTRDIVDVNVDIDGWLVRLGDMAGLRADKAVSDNIKTAAATHMSSDIIGEIEREGIRRARERALQSDLVIVLTSLHITPQGSAELAINSELIKAVNQCYEAGKHMLFTVNKIDLLHQQNKSGMVSVSSLLSRLVEIFPFIDPNEVFLLSCLDTEPSLKAGDSDDGGLQIFLSGLTQKFSSMTSAAIGSESASTEMTPAEAQSYWTASLSVTHRQSQYLQSCLIQLNNFLDLSSTSDASKDHDFIPKLSSVGMPSEMTSAKRISSPKSLPEPPSQPFFDTTNANADVDHNYDHDFHTDHHDDLVHERFIPQPRPISTPQPIAADSSASSMSNSSLSTSPVTHADSDVDIVLAAEYLRSAADCLASLTGRGDGTDVEDLLGVVFEKFCVGK